MCDDDDWASDDDNDISNTNKLGSMSNKEWEKIKSNFEKDGYRQGLEASQEKALQDGFNTAFKQAFEMALAAGMVHGDIGARLHHDSDASSAALNKLPGQGDTCKESQTLEDVNEKVSTMISSIPNLLYPENEEMEHCCSASNASHVCECKSSAVELNLNEQNCSNELTLKFLDQLRILKSSINSIGND